MREANDHGVNVKKLIFLHEHSIPNLYVHIWYVIYVAVSFASKAFTHVLSAFTNAPRSSFSLLVCCSSLVHLGHVFPCD